MFTDRRILTVDDSSFIRVLVRNVLSKQGGQVDEASDGHSALARFAENTYDLVLLDLMLPDLDGIQVLEQMRQTNDECVITMLSGAGDLKTALSAVQRGADGYIEKQDLSRGDDFAQFFYSLTQAQKHRAGLVAQKQLRQLQADFYSMVAHDMRSPLVSMVMAVETLEDALENETPQIEPAEVLDIIRRGCEKLQRLVNNYLELTKIEAGYLQLTLEKTELRQLVEASANLARLPAHNNRHTLTLRLPPEPLWATVDGDQLQQAFDNLINNAIKYTPAGGQITIELSVETEHLLFRVTDTGNGIPPAQLPALFTKYHRLRTDATRQIKGTGLGLLIVKEIVEAHHGSVQVASTGLPGEGASFTILLPRQILA